MWRSPLSRERLIARSQLLARIRDFFAHLNTIEVEVPALGARTVTDLHLSPIEARACNRALYLQTSPEFFMKRLLAGGSGSIYSLAKAFRDDEAGPRHNPEFTLLEWYQLDIDDVALMDQTEALFKHLVPEIRCNRVSYGAVFEQYLALDPHHANVEQLQACVDQHLSVNWLEQDRNTLLDLLFSHLVEPQLQALTFVYDYPASQCALAKVSANSEGVAVAKRFEVFWRGLELGNAYWELTDAAVQRQRFEQDLTLRAGLGRACPEMDDRLLAALNHGIPECAGIAIGVDRLFMCMEGLDSIVQAQSFAFDHL